MLHSILWLPSRLYSSLWLPSSFLFYTAAFGCLQALLAIQQPWATFKLCLLNSGLLLPSSFACYTAAFGCLQVLFDTTAVGCLQALLACSACYTALLNIQQPLAAFKLYLLYSSLWLPSRFACYTAVFCCLQALLAIQQPFILIATQQPLAAFKL